MNYIAYNITMTAYFLCNLKYLFYCIAIINIYNNEYDYN